MIRLVSPFLKRDKLLKMIASAFVSTVDNGFSSKKIRRLRSKVRAYDRLSPNSNSEGRGNFYPVSQIS